MSAMLVFSSALFLYISTFLLLPCPSYYSQPFGISRSSLHKWCPLSETDEAVTRFIKWLFRKSKNGSRNGGITETLTAQWQSGLVARWLPGRSGANSERNDAETYLEDGFSIVKGRPT
jgi:hypothetical protein